MNRLTGLRFAVFVLCAGVVVSVSCGKSEKTYTIEIKDGVKHIHNNAPLWGNKPKVSLEFIRQIGSVETKDSNLQLYRPLDITVDIYCNYYILDNGNYRIQKFDSSMKYIATFGRKGQGPGELNYPISIELDTKGNLYVMDQGNYRLIIFSPDGKVLPGLLINRPNEWIRILPDGAYVLPSYNRVNLRNAPTEAPKNPALIDILDAKGTIIKSFGVPAELNDRWYNMVGNDYFLHIDTDGNLYISFHHLNRIEHYTLDGKLHFTADRPLNFEISKIKSSVEISEGMTTIMARPMNSVSAGIGVDHKNRIWVAGLKRQINRDEVLDITTGSTENDKVIISVKGNTSITETDMYQLEVYDNNGVLLGILPITHFCDAFRVCGDRIFIIDTYRAMCVYEYKIVEK